MNDGLARVDRATTHREDGAMGAVEDITSRIDIDQLAALLGTDPSTAQAATQAAIPALLGGLQANASTADGAASLAAALDAHADSPATGENLDQIDTEDGRRILAHVLADDPQRLSGVSQLGGDLLAKLLPILAPIVLRYLAERFTGTTSDQTGSSGDLGDLLGGLLGSSGSAAASGGLGDLLGGILGTGTAGADQSQGADLGSLLGSILGR